GLAVLGERAPLAQDGPRLAMGAPERRPAAVPDRAVLVQQPVHRSADELGQYRDTAGELPPWPGPDFFDRPAKLADPGARALPGIFHPGRLEDLRSADREPGTALHAEFPVDGNQRTDRRLQPADAAARVSWR